MTASVTAPSSPAVGDEAPALSLPSTGGGTVSLADFRGRKHVLLAFFPLAFTSTCTAEVCSFSDDYGEFAGRDVEVLPISVDSVPTLKEFKAKERVSVDMLSDFKREASRAYGVLREDTFFANRAYFLIDRDGVVRWAHVESNPGERRQNSEILEAIAALG